MKTNELTGKALNWAVGKAEGLDGWLAPVNYCGQWEHGGPIIEREEITIGCIEGPEELKWEAIKLTKNGRGVFCFKGPTPLIAAMRCYVASKLGADVDVPKELV
jgi:hypothetical protein